MNNPGKEHFYSKDVPGHLVQRAISLLLRVQSTNYLYDEAVTECKMPYVLHLPSTSTCELTLAVCKVTEGRTDDLRGSDSLWQ